MPGPLSEFQRYLNMIAIRANERQAIVNMGGGKTLLATHDKRSEELRAATRKLAEDYIARASAGRAPID